MGLFLVYIITNLVSTLPSIFFHKGWTLLIYEGIRSLGSSFHRSIPTFPGLRDSPLLPLVTGDSKPWDTGGLKNVSPFSLTPGISKSSFLPLYTLLLVVSRRQVVCMCVFLAGCFKWCFSLLTAQECLS